MLFDFEMAGLGAIASTRRTSRRRSRAARVSAYCPGDVADAATTAYEHVLEEEDVRLGQEWDASVAAALACWVVGRWRLVRDAIEDDREWGTSTIRPRLLVWLAAVTEACQASLPVLAATCDQLRQMLGRRWHEPPAPVYLSLGGDGPITRSPASWSGRGWTAVTIRHQIRNSAGRRSDAMALTKRSAKGQGLARQPSQRLGAVQPR